MNALGFIRLLLKFQNKNLVGTKLDLIEFRKFEEDDKYYAGVFSEVDLIIEVPESIVVKRDMFVDKDTLKKIVKKLKKDDVLHFDYKDIDDSVNEKYDTVQIELYRNDKKVITFNMANTVSIASPDKFSLIEYRMPERNSDKSYINCNLLPQGYCNFIHQNKAMFSTDNLRPSLMQLMFSNKSICATNGHKLIWQKTNNPEEVSGCLKTSVSKLTHKTLKETEVRYYYELSEHDGDKKSIFYINGHREDLQFSIRSKSSEKALGYDRVVFDKFTNGIKINRKEFIEKLGLVMTTANKKTSQLELTIDFENNTLDLYTEYLDFGYKSSLKIDCETKHVNSNKKLSNYTFGFNGKKLEELLLEMKSDIVYMSGINSDVAFVFEECSSNFDRISDESSYIIEDRKETKVPFIKNDKFYILMPVLLKDY